MVSRRCSYRRWVSTTIATSGYRARAAVDRGWQPTDHRRAIVAARSDAAGPVRVDGDAGLIGRPCSKHQVVVAVAVVVVAVGVGLVLRRRQQVAAPTQPSRAIPAQLDRADFEPTGDAVVGGRVLVGDVRHVCRCGEQGFRACVRPRSASSRSSSRPPATCIASTTFRSYRWSRSQTAKVSCAPASLARLPPRTCGARSPTLREQ